MLNFKAKLLFQYCNLEINILNLAIVNILGNSLKIKINNNILLLSFITTFIDSKIT